jgi:3-oxoacyl-[acyl-carrier-protein] synthase II
MNLNRKVYVSGMGVLAPNAVGVDAFCRNVRLGHSGISGIDRFDTSKLRCRIGGLVREGDRQPANCRVPEYAYDRVSLLARVACDEALEHAKLSDLGVVGLRCGIVLGIALGGMSSLEKCYAGFLRQDIGPSIEDFIASMPNMAAAILAMEYGIRGLNYTLNTACSSSAAAIGLGFWLVRAGVLDVCIAGGAEAPLTPAILANFETLRVLNLKSNAEPERAVKPFSRDRQGMVLSEGSGIVILESDEHLDRRGEQPLCEILGYGASDDAAHLIAPDSAGQALAIQSALADAGVFPEQVDYIQAHGTGTRQNDAVETASIKSVWKADAHRVPVSSIKSMIGHTLGAAGALSFIATVGALRESFLPPTINLDMPDPDCDLDYVANSSRRQPLRIALVNSFGFGGHNNVLVVGRTGSANLQ